MDGRMWWVWKSWSDACIKNWIRKSQIRTWLAKWNRNLIPKARWCISKRALVIFIDERTDGRATATIDKQRVLRGTIIIKEANGTMYYTLCSKKVIRFAVFNVSYSYDTIQWNLIHGFLIAVGYTGWAKKSKPTLSTHNFVKYWPIFKILSLSRSPGNLQ